jgi:secretion/DNA translocation related CpaE-like protein
MRNGQRGRTGPPRWTPGQAPPEVVLVGATERLQDDVARIAAAAGMALRVADGPPQPGAAAERATLLLAGGAAAGVPGAGGDVIVVGFAAESARLWELAAAVGAQRVAVLPDAAAWLAEYLGRHRHPDRTGTVAAVLGGSGGLGCSTLACWLAGQAAADGMPTLLVDADVLGGGLDCLLGAQAVPGLRWQDLAGVKGSISPAQLRSALPVVGGFSLLSWGPDLPAAGGQVPAEVIREAVSAAAAGFALVIIDAGRLHTGLDGWLGQAGQAVLVAGPGERQLRAAAAAAAVLQPLVPLAVIRGPLPAGMDAELAAERLQLPLGAYLPRLAGTAAAEHAGRLLAQGRTRAVARRTRPLLGLLAGGGQAGDQR